MKDDGHDTCRDREEDLRAEVAALRDALEEQGALAQEWGDAYRRTERELAEARAETAKHIVGMVFRACQGFKEGGHIFGIIDDDVRAFLRGGEGKT